MARETEGGLPDEIRIERPEEELEAGARWLRSYREGGGQERLVVCGSGGVDSTPTAHWAARAVGADRLVLLSLPCGVVSSGSEKPADAEDSVRE